MSPTSKEVVGLGTHVDGPAGTDRDSPGLGTQPSEVERWRERLNDYLTRRQRVARDREAMTNARSVGLARRHAQRLIRVAAATPTNDATPATAPREAVHGPDGHHHADHPAADASHACPDRTTGPAS